MTVVVGITVRDQANQPFDDALVRVFAWRGGNSFLDEEVTGSGGLGRVEFNLTGSRTGTHYAVQVVVLRDPPLLYGSPVQHTICKSITVFDPPLAQHNDENEFTFTLPSTSNLESQDPLLCRCHMKAVHLDKRPIEGYRLHIRQMYLPETLHEEVPEQGVNGSIVAGDRIVLVSDKEGMMAVDLVRGGTYQVFSMSRAESAWLFRVPDKSSADLTDLIYPYAKEITFDSYSLSLGVGEEVHLPVSSLLLSDDTEVDLEGNEYEPSRFVTPLSSDLDALPLQWSRDGGGGADPARRTLLITAKEAGIFTVTFTPQGSLKSGLPVRYPTPQVIHDPITVTVT